MDSGFTHLQNKHFQIFKCVCIKLNPKSKKISINRKIVDIRFFPRLRSSACKKSICTELVFK